MFVAAKCATSQSKCSSNMQTKLSTVVSKCLSMVVVTYMYSIYL